MDKEPICIMDIYFEHYDNFKYNKEMCKDAYVISGEDLAQLENKIVANDFRRKFFEKQYRKCVDIYKIKIAYYKEIVHVYKVELGRCRRKLTRIYQMLYDFYYCDFGDKDDAKQFVKEWKNV